MSLSLTRRFVYHSLRPIAIVPRLVPCRRFLSTNTVPVELKFDVYEPKQVKPGVGPLLLLHGLFGKGRNWTSLAKSFARVLHRPVYTVDLRNHGSSPHSDIMTYDAMAADVLHLCDKHSLSNISLLGHSMGGKVAMTVALSSSLPSDLIKSLIVADIAPSRGRLSPDFEMYLQAMHKIEDAKLKTRKEADHMLHEFVKETPIRQFLLTNLDAHSHPLKFSIPLKIISESITNIGDFPHHPDDGALYYGRTLFIKGEKSRYINEKNVQHAYAMFPDMEIKTLHTGHWVHSESPAEFQKLVVDFIQEGER